MDKNVVIVVLAGVALGGIAAYMYDGMGGTAPTTTTDQNGFNEVLWTLDNDAEFLKNGGVAWTSGVASFENDRFQIGTYGKWVDRGYRSMAVYRMQWFRPNQRIRLDTLNAQGFVAQRPPKSALRIAIRTCDRVPADGQEFQNFCYNDNPTYSSGLITTPGPVNLTENLSHITTDQNVMLELAVYMNTSNTVPAENRTYWDSIRLTAQQAE